MMEASLTFTLTSQQVLHMYLTEGDKQVTQLLPVATSDVKQPVDSLDALTAKARAEIENRTYHMGADPTPGKDYDDRLFARLNCSATTAYKYLGLPERRGGIRHQRLGKKYHITERAIREWEGDPVK